MADHQPQKVKIITSLQCWGPVPSLGTPIEQRLTISVTGRVWFTEYVQGEWKPLQPEQNPLGRRQQLSIGQEKARELLSLVARYLDGDPLPSTTMDAPVLEMKLTNTDGTIRKYQGSVAGEVKVDGIDVSQVIRQAIPIEGLVAFG